MSLIDSLDLQAIVDAKTDEELVFGLSDAASLQATPYEQLRVLRMLAFPRLAATIADPAGKITEWAVRMAKQYSAMSVTVRFTAE